MEKLEAGKTAKVIKVDGTEEEVKIRQVPLKDYKKGFTICEDEISRVGFICAKDEAWVYSLTPESYEMLAVETEKVNTHFFAFCARQQQELTARINQMRPEIAQAAIERLSSAGSQPRVPRPVC